ncbi:Zn-ribbon domain-containing OB-fold protein [Nocardia sp. NPDC004711]
MPPAVLPLRGLPGETTLVRTHQHRFFEVSMNSHSPEDAGNISDDSERPADRLMIQHCVDCDRLFGPLTGACSLCASPDLEWVPSAGVGSIVSWRLMDRAGIDRHVERVPLTIAIVELDEGPWIYTSIEGDVPLLPIGPVRVRFQPRPWAHGLPVFTVSADPRDSENRR